MVGCGRCHQKSAVPARRKTAPVHLTRVKKALKVKGEGSPVVKERSATQQNRTMTMGCMAPLQLGRLRRPSTRREAGSLGYSPRATRAGQKSAGCEGCVHQVCRPRSGVQKGRTLPLRVWVSLPQVDGGWIEGALGLGCRSRAPHGVPRTEPSAPCCVAAAPELFIELSRTERSKLKGRPRVFGRRSRARQRVPRTRHSCEVLRRVSSLANDK